MTYRRPFVIDASLAPANKLRPMLDDASELIDPVTLPEADSSQAGTMSSADFDKLALLDPALQVPVGGATGEILKKNSGADGDASWQPDAGGAAVSDDDPEPIGTAAGAGVSADAARSDHVHAHGAQTDDTLHAGAIAGGAAGFLSGTDKQKLDGIAAAAEVNDAVNVGTSPSAIVSRIYTGSKTGAQLQLRSLRSGRLMRAREVGNQVYIDHDPSFVTRETGLPKARVHAGSKLAGSTLRPNQTGDSGGLIATKQGGFIVHDTSHLHPFINWCEFDFYGYPHHKFAQMNGQSPISQQVSKGYEHGQKFRAGDMVRRAGRGARYELRCLFLNVGWSDAFTEFVLEPNPVADIATGYTGAHRMRFLSGELGITDPDWLLLTFWCELAVHRAQEYSWEGATKIYSSSGVCLRAIEHGGYTDSGFNWLQNDAKLQLRARVDRIANLDTYNDTYQGSNQGLNLLRLDMRRWKFQPIGFEPLREL